VAGNNASFADMKRMFPNPELDPLALDDEDVERLLDGGLAPARRHPGTSGVAVLLAATVAESSDEELVGKAAAMAELRAATRARLAASTRARPQAAEASEASLGRAGGGPGGRAGDGWGGRGGHRQPPGTGAERRPEHPRYRGWRWAGRTTEPGQQPAFLAGKGAEQGKKPDATAFQDLAKLAGGAGKIPSYCEEVLGGDATPKEGKPQQPPGGSGQGGPPTSTGAGSQGQNDQRTTRS
jgi:hypothetical protein